MRSKAYSRPLLNLHQHYIYGTVKESIVQNIRLFVCSLTVAVSRDALGVTGKKLSVYMSSRALKHMYDKRPAVEYDFLIQHAYKIVRHPDHVYKNKSGKKGEFCFVKRLKNDHYLCSLEVKELGEEHELEIVTIFRLSKEKYLHDYELLWSWRADTPSS